MPPGASPRTCFEVPPRAPHVSQAGRAPDRGILRMRLRLDLPNPLSGDARDLAHLLQGPQLRRANPKPHSQHALLLGGQVRERLLRQLLQLRLLCRVVGSGASGSGTKSSRLASPSHRTDASSERALALRVLNLAMRAPDRPTAVEGALETSRVESRIILGGIRNAARQALDRAVLRASARHLCRVGLLLQFEGKRPQARLQAFHGVSIVSCQARTRNVRGGRVFRSLKQLTLFNILVSAALPNLHVQVGVGVAASALGVLTIAEFSGS